MSTPRGWSFLGGLLIVSTITYLNITTITILSKDIQTSLSRESKKLEAAANKNKHPSQQQPQHQSSESSIPAPQMGDIIKWPITTTRVADRIKKMWNQDIEKGIRQVQKTDWERLGRGFKEHMKRAQERIVTSFERMGEDSTKKST
jgi:hypothetical protein